jgi:hypothetical protein
MKNIEAAAQLINLILGGIINLTMAAQQYSAVVDKARAEGRDVSDAELAALAAQTDTKMAETMALLGAGPPQT